MNNADSVAQAIFQGCGANLGPLIGTELESGAVSVEAVPEPPEGDLAVLTIGCEVEGESLPMLYLASPLSEIVTLARRMLNDEEPDKERDLSDKDLDSVGEVLNLMSGALDQVIREQVNPTLRVTPCPWWRTSVPGDNEFEEGNYQLATGSLSIDSGSTVQLLFRFPVELLKPASDREERRIQKQVLLLGLDDQLQQSLQPLLESAQHQVEAAEPGAEDIDEVYARSGTIILSGDGDGDRAFELCRRLRLGNATWSKTTILCMAEPTRNQVIRGIESGASHVLRIPTDDKTLLRVLKRARAGA